MTHTIIYQVDAFTSEVFGGNPAAVVPLDEWIEDEMMQKIAMENNLSETAFFVEKGNEFELRWFTPKLEMELCGHATLAAAHVIFEHHGFLGNEIRFHTASGLLTVSIDENDHLSMSFPVWKATPINTPPQLIEALGVSPLEVHQAKYMLVVLHDEDEVHEVSPNFDLLKTLDCLGVIVTAKGEECDFVSRFFAPSAGINEDPVTGSAHCTLIPYWAERLDKNELHARQVSARKGELFCEYVSDSVKIAGNAVTYMQGEIFIDTF